MIALENINLRFGDKILYDNFNLEVQEGEILLLNGPSGCGKSSLLKMIPGFLHPDNGQVLLEGKVLDKRSFKSFRKRISYVSQDVDLREEILKDLLTEIFQFRINRHIASPLDKVENLLAELKLSSDVLDKNVRELSGGERQRIGIIICLVLDRDIWLLDEVTSALDSELKEAVAERIRQSGKTVFVISHDPQWKEIATREVFIGNK